MKCTYRDSRLEDFGGAIPVSALVPVGGAAAAGSAMRALVWEFM